jgi:ribosomal-protein-alanine N-acetyltransferase
MKIHYQSDRLYVRNLIPSDAEGIFELDTDPLVMKYLGGVTMTSLTKAREVVKNIIWQYTEFGMGRWAIIDRSTGEFIGWTGIKRERNLREFVYYDLGYRLKSKFWNQGIATETALFSIYHGFNTLGLKKIHAATHEKHKTSQKVLLKCGLQKQDSFKLDGKTHFWYGITKDEWELSN